MPQCPTPDTSEYENPSAVVSAVILALGSRTDVRVWRANAGVARPIGRPEAVVRFGIPGQADISGIIRGGRRLEVEVKTGAGRQSATQRRFGAMIEKYGGVYLVVRSAEEACAAIDELGLAPE